jgi:hypothetical protein
MPPLVWRDPPPPTIETHMETLRKHKNRWALLYTKRTNNAAHCKASELRKRFGDIEFLVYRCEIYARSTEGQR